MVTGVTAFLHLLSEDEYKAALDHLPHRWEKCVGSAGDYIDRGHMCEQSGISIVLLS